MINDDPTYQQPLRNRCATSAESSAEQNSTDTIRILKGYLRDTPCVPQRRFHEYTEEWQEYTLGGENGVCEFRNGYTPSKANNAYWTNGNIPWFRMEDIREHGRILGDAIQHITPEAVKGGLFEAGSIIMATTATIGEHALLIADSLANQRFTNLKIRKSLKEKIDSYFFFYYCYHISAWCKRNTNYGGLLSVNMDALKKLKIYIPKDINEQKKIASCLLSIDNAISATTQKLEQFKAQKNALLQKLFPQRGKTNPELRFPRFHDKWIEYTLGGEGGLCEFRNGYTPSKANSAYWTNGTIPWFRMEDIRVHGRILSDAIQHITQEAVNGELFEAGSVIISTTATIGEHALLIADSLANQQFTNFKIRKSHKKEVDTYFFYYYCYQIAQWCKYNTNSGGLLSVNMDGLKRYKLYIPKDIKEQKKIVECLRAVDILIDDTELMMKQLLQQKQGLLQQLFPKI